MQLQQAQDLRTEVISLTLLLQEYTGIDVRRLEQMEARLKADVLREAELHGNRLLIAREVMGSDEGQTATIVDNFVPVEGYLPLMVLRSQKFQHFS